MMSQRPALRRRPKQERGERRVEHILDVAAEVFDEVGYEAATTVMIAARARTSVGSLYQFFPNKDAIVQSLSERYVTQLRQVFATVIIPDLAKLPLAVQLDRLVDPLISLELSHQGFRTLFLETYPSGTFAAATQALNHELIERVEAIFAARVPMMSVEQRHKHTLVCIQIVKALLALARPIPGRSPALTSDDALAESKAVLLAYLTPIVGDSVRG